MRPLIAIPARFSSSAAALRYEAEVAARKLIEAVYAAGGEPLVVHPSAPGGTVSDAEVARRLGFADGVLLPGREVLPRIVWIRMICVKPHSFGSKRSGRSP